MEEKLASLLTQAINDINQSTDEGALKDIRIRYLGKKGELTAILRGMGQLSPQDRPRIGKLANEVREEVEEQLRNRLARLQAGLRSAQLARERIDVTLPGTPVVQGHHHPLLLVLDEMIRIFVGMGFTVVEGREIETDYYNFEALNIPKNHPARDMQDTFYVDNNHVLRTHTSPMQIHTMEALAPNEPVRIICPGKTYRRDDDATHSSMFHQIEGLVVGENVTLGDLKGTLEAFFQEMYGQSVKARLRPSYFPFTEPSAELDISCFFCESKGCSVCKQSGWLEMLGSGMVHPNVLRNVGYDPEKVSGFAFGMGVERIAMLKLGISDIRHLFSNDVRMLEQF